MIGPGAGLGLLNGNVAASYSIAAGSGQAVNGSEYSALGPSLGSQVARKQPRVGGR